MKRLSKLIGVWCLSLCVVGAVVAQEEVPIVVVPSPPADSPGATLVDWGKAGIKWLTENGEIGAGVGGTWDALGRGEFSAVMIQQFNLLPRAWRWKAGPIHTSCFSSDKAHEGLGIGASVMLLHFDPLEAVKIGPVSLLSDWRLGGGISVDVDRAIDGRFDARNTVSYLTLSKTF